jgi:hypothetical protein
MQAFCFELANASAERLDPLLLLKALKSLLQRGLFLIKRVDGLR